jgi:hypothetical protein
MDWKFDGATFASATDRQAAERHVREELAGAVLLEVLIQNPDSQFSVDDFGQAGNDQAPYSEAFLSQDGQTVLSENSSDVDMLRLAFYLHYVDPGQPLKTSYGTLRLPAIGAMPTRLATLIPYEPVT